MLLNVAYISLADFFSKQLVELAKELEGLSTVIWISQDQPLAEETQNFVGILQNNLENVEQMMGGQWWELERRWRRRARRFDLTHAIHELSSQPTQGISWGPGPFRG